MRLSHFIYFFIGITCLFSCKKTDPAALAEANASELNKYQDYITNVSPSTISVYDNVFVVLQSPVGGWSDNQELSQDVFTVSPSVKAVSYTHLTLPTKA